MKNFLVGLLFILTIPIWGLPAAIYCLGYLLHGMGEDLITIYNRKRK